MPPEFKRYGGLLQFVLLYTFGININQILFVDILHSTNSRDWIMGFYTGDSWNMRITGLNFENSMFVHRLYVLGWHSKEI